MVLDLPQESAVAFQVLCFKMTVPARGCFQLFRLEVVFRRVRSWAYGRGTEQHFAFPLDYCLGVPVYQGKSSLAQVRRSGLHSEPAAKYALVKACSTTEVGSEIIDNIRMIEHRCQMRIWYARVPTHSIPADGPSRLIVDGLESSLVSDVSWVLSSADWGFPSGSVDDPH